MTEQMNQTNPTHPTRQARRLHLAHLATTYRAPLVRRGVTPRRSPAKAFSPMPRDPRS